MIRPCAMDDFNEMLDVINDGADAYRGHIPADCWKVPYMQKEYLSHEIGDGVRFYAFESEGSIAGVMGIQDVRDVTLIRHAYVRTRNQQKGIGGLLIGHLMRQASFPVLIGTWRAATWAVSFYEKNGFLTVSEESKNRLLTAYWKITERQIETSVVLAEERYYEQFR